MAGSRESTMGLMQSSLSCLHSNIYQRLYSDKTRAFDWNV